MTFPPPPLKIFWSFEIAVISNKQFAFASYYLQLLYYRIHTYTEYRSILHLFYIKSYKINPFFKGIIAEARYFRLEKMLEQIRVKSSLHNNNYNNFVRIIDSEGKVYLTTKRNLMSCPVTSLNDMIPDEDFYDEYPAWRAFLMLGWRKAASFAETVKSSVFP